MAGIGIVIVTYNSQAEIGDCLDAAARTGAEIVVIDNASSDQTVAEVARRHVRLIANPINRGFAAAVNQGFTALATPYVLILNPDAVLESDLEPLREACDLPGAGAAGGRLVDSRGRPQIGFMVRQLPTPAALVLEALVLNRIWPENPVNRKYRGLHLDYSTRVEVEQPAGAFLMVRREVWKELGGLDEAYFPLWFEDVDFCRRMKDRGYRLFFEPRAVGKHTGGHSIPRIAVEMRPFYWYGNLLRYSASHFRASAFRAVCLAVVAGSLARMIAESALRGSWAPMTGYWKVVRLAGRSFWRGWRNEAFPVVPVRLG